MRTLPALGLTALLALGAWLAVKPPPAAPPSKVVGAASSSSVPSPATPLPERLNRPMLETADKDPFIRAQRPPVTAPVKVAPVAPQAPPVVASSPPQAPALNLRFTGRATAPDGGQLVYASLGDTTVALVPGQTLPNGYQVEAIEKDAVLLRFAGTGATTRLDLPPPPPFEIR